MGDKVDDMMGMGPLTVAASAKPLPPKATDRPSKRLSHKVIAGEGGMYQLLQAMRKASGLSLRVLAERMGIQRNSLNQYFWQRRGEGGSSRLGWFLRFAEACGCRVWITFPSLHEQMELKAEYEKPAGNPNWVKRDEKSE